MTSNHQRCFGSCRQPRVSWETPSTHLNKAARSVRWVRPATNFGSKLALTLLCQRLVFVPPCEQFAQLGLSAQRVQWSLFSVARAITVLQEALHRPHVLLVRMGGVLV
jgi:hypothetical protein